MGKLVPDGAGKEARWDAILIILREEAVNLGGVLAEGSVRALALHGREQGVEVTKETVEVLRGVLRRELPGIMGELSDAQYMGDAMIKHLLNVQCNHVAVLALAEVG